MINYIKTVLALLLLTVSHQAYSQAVLPAKLKIIGSWARGNRGFVITDESINRLYKDADTWTENSFAAKKFYFIDSTLAIEKNRVTVWAAASYISRRDYLADDTEQSVETTEYVRWQFEWLKGDRLSITDTRSWYVNRLNQSPELYLPNQIKKNFQGPNGFNRPRIMGRIKR